MYVYMYTYVHTYAHTHIFQMYTQFFLTWYKIDPCRYKNEHEQQIFVEHLLNARHCTCSWGHRRERTRHQEHLWQ